MRQLVRNLRIELLGPVRAWHGDGELDLGSARRRAVFAMLAMRAGRIVSRQEHRGFLVEAMAVAALRDGEPEQALAVYLPILDRRYARMMLRHQWLPSVVRIALELGRTDVAHTAWDVRRAESRLAPHGIRRARHVEPGAGPVTEHLSPSEPRIAELVAEGWPVSDIWCAGTRRTT